MGASSEDHSKNGRLKWSHVFCSYLTVQAELSLPAVLGHGATWAFAFGAHRVSTIHYVGDEAPPPAPAPVHVAVK